MIQKIKLKRGLDISIEGQAAESFGSLMLPEIFAVVPDHFHGIIPKMVVKEGDTVQAGDALFHDKTFTEMNFTAPVSGKVLGINRGERRKILSITIEADRQVAYRKFELPALASLSGEEVKSSILQSGLWAFIKQRPYDVIANPTKAPKAIFISSFDSAPLAPNYEFVVRGQGADLQAGINALAKMTQGKVHIGVKAGAQATDFRALHNVTLTEFEGPHPAGNVGVQINNVSPINKGETVWTVNIQDVILIGRLFNKGIVDYRKRVALTGPLVYEPKYFNVLYGTPVSAIIKSNVHKEITLRVIEGNVLSGHKVEENETLSPYVNQVSVIADGSDTHELIGWAMPRFDKFSANGTYFSALLESKCYRLFMPAMKYAYDARLLGGRRAIIMSGEYDKVLPMDIYTEFLIKAMIAGNLDKMEQLGAYEIAPEDVALCEFVCTSKMPLQAIVRKALDNMKQEIE